MSRLTEAMAVEQTYLEHRMKGEEPFHLVDRITGLGYGSLAEYFAEKQAYVFNQLSFEYIEKTPADCIAEVLRMIEEKVTGVLFVDSEEQFVFCGNGCEYDAEYCDDNGVAVYPIFTNGGCIVSSPGDFSVGISAPEGTGVNVAYILDHIAAILGEHMDSVTISGNDVLVGGKKVIGSASYNQNGMCMFVAHVSFTDSSALVEKICRKEAVKEPGCIGGTSREDFKREVSEWLLKH